MPNALSSDRDRPARAGRRESWPTPGTRVFTGADLESAVAAAVAEFGAGADVQAARSVKQGLRGRTHVEVLVAVPAAGRGSVGTPPSMSTASADDEDPVESTLAALLASADAEEQALQQRARQERAAAAEPFAPPQLAGNPSFAAEFASAFPAALAAAKADGEPGDQHPAEPQPRRPRVVRAAPARRERPIDEFTARVRDALQRVPQADDDDELEDAEVVEPDTDLLPAVPAGASGFVPADPAHLVPATPARPHPAPGLFDEPTVRLPAEPGPVAASGPATPPLPPPLPPNERLQDAVRPAPPAEPKPSPRPRPTPGAAVVSRPPALRGPHAASAPWSRVRLRGLGVPEEVLAALPEQEPAEDLRWLVALTDAIGATVPAPVLDGDADVTATGRGVRGALALLRLGVAGVAPSMLVVDGRAVPATATELALTIRAAIVR